MRSHRSLYLMPLLIVTIIAACSSDSEMPTLTLEGDELTYDGPPSFDDKSITFRLVNNSDEFVHFAWGEITDDTITSEEDVAWGKKGGSEPPWVGAWYKFGLVGPGETEEATTVVFDGRIDLVAYSAESSSPRTYVAGIFEVTDVER